MHALPLPLTHEVVLIGGGHSHALLLRQWGMKPLAGARLTLINPSATAPYTGMLPGFVAGHYGRDALEIDLVRLARFAGARMIFGRVTAIHPNERVIEIEGRAPIPYDLGSLDIGITSDMPQIPGFSEHGIAAKPLGPFSARWSQHLNGSKGPVVVIGGGVAGIELALSMAHALGGNGLVSVVEAETALAGVSATTRQHLLNELAATDIALYQNVTVTSVGSDHVTLSDDTEIPAALVVGAAGARPFPWLEETGLDLSQGYVTVDETLRSTSHANIFAVGDCAHLSQSPRPKAGVFAVRAAPVLADNLRAALSGTPLRPFSPQKHYLKLVSLGRKAALADKWGRSIKGDWVWRWKDRIDAAFMEKLAALPEMTVEPLPSERTDRVETALGPKPLCGGCGSKVGADILDGVLADLPEVPRDDVHLGKGDDAAVLGLGDSRLVVTTDHLRAFWNDPYLFARIAALHALGDIWAMGADPQAALAQITLPPLTPDLQSGWMREIMQAASQVFTDEGAVIAGGHSTTGAELTVGFTVTGLPSDRTITQSGGQIGDLLLLTRPIGSGVLLAAEMEKRAPGDAVESALRIMARSQGDAAKHLSKSAHAMTDITGFGLAGHVARLAEASGVTARIALDNVLFYDEAEGLAAQGIRSTIWASNRSAHAVDVPETPRADLLFDPQTAGGLLAALPKQLASDLLETLRKLGHDAAIIGELQPKAEISLIAR